MLFSSPPSYIYDPYHVPCNLPSPLAFLSNTLLPSSLLNPNLNLNSLKVLVPDSDSREGLTTFASSQKQPIISFHTHPPSQRTCPPMAITIAIAYSQSPPPSHPHYNYNVIHPLYLRRLILSDSLVLIYLVTSLSLRKYERTYVREEGGGKEDVFRILSILISIAIDVVLFSIFRSVGSLVCVCVPV